MRMLIVFMLLIASSAPLLSVGQSTNSTLSTVSSYLISTWTVELPTTCLPSSECCCFTGAVDIFNSTTGELYVNGSVTGDVCAAPVAMDSLNSPASYQFLNEFFGIDDFEWTLANATYNTLAGLSLSVLSANHPKCNFTLFRSSATPLSSSPSSVTPLAATVPSFDTVFEGSNWNFDSGQTCSNQPSCCCWTGLGTIVPNSLGAETFLVTAPTTSGCFVNESSITDDFPWPSSSSVTTSVSGMLPLNDDYNIALTSSGNVLTIVFSDVSKPQCSFNATRIASSSGSPSSASSLQLQQATATLHAFVTIATSFIILALALF